MKKFGALILLLAQGISSFACTTFLLSKNGHHVFGRNYDWVTENGMVMINARGALKAGIKGRGEESFLWQSIYGSVSFNQYGKEFPTGGMNEKGLVVELMWLNETQYPRPDKRAALGELQWIQYQLDCSATIEEVIASDKKLRIAEKSVPLHFLIADATGAAASIEFLGGKMVVHRNSSLPFPVLSNSVYEQVLKETKAKPASAGMSSGQRFATACRMVQEYQQSDIKGSPVDYAFSILNNVAQGDFTRWSIVYDITSRQIHFFTEKHKQHKSFLFSDLNFSCIETPRAFRLNTEAGGDVAKLFLPLTWEQNRELIEQSAKESRSEVAISKESVEEAANAFGKTCK